MALVVVAGFRYSDWAVRAADLMAERGSTEIPDDDSAPEDDSAPDDDAALD